MSSTTSLWLSLAANGCEADTAACPGLLHTGLLHVYQYTPHRSVANASCTQCSSCELPSRQGNRRTPNHKLLVHFQALLQLQYCCCGCMKGVNPVLDQDPPAPQASRPEPLLTPEHKLMLLLLLLFPCCCSCNNGVNFMLDQDPKAVFRLAALQSPAGRRLLRRCGRSPDDISSIGGAPGVLRMQTPRRNRRSSSPASRASYVPFAYAPQAPIQA